MEISVPNAPLRNALLAACAVLGAILIFQAVELWIADRWITSQNLYLVERGAALIPSNGSAWDNLGHLQQWNLTDSDLQAAISDYHQALREDPRSAHYWMDLASAEEASGDDSGASNAFIQAEAVYPDSAEVAFYYGNFLLRQQEYFSAFAELGRAVKTDPSLLPLAISRAWRATSNANQIVDHLLPPNINSYLQAMDYFAAIHEGDAALAVWSRLANLKTKVPLSSTFPMFDELIRQNRGADARRAWMQAVFDSKQAAGYAAGPSLVWNGDFADDFAGGGLSWRWDPIAGTYLSFEAAPPQGGSRALRLDFNGGSNVNLTEPYQYVPVAPNQRYHFHALMRTEGISTESGLRFAITDPNHVGAVNVVTENFVGTREWTPMDADLTTGPETNFLVIRLVRAPSRLFDNKLEGTVWVADVSLVSDSADAEPRP